MHTCEYIFMGCVLLLKKGTKHAHIVPSKGLYVNINSCHKLCNFSTNFAHNVV